MHRRTRIVALLGAVLLAALGAVPASEVADRLLPHAIQLWDSDECAESSRSDHAIFGLTGLALQPGHSPVRIVQAHPLGLSTGARWRAWVVPVAPHAEFTGAVATDTPPPGWRHRAAAAGATLAPEHPAELDLEIWPGPGQTRTSLRGFLVAYRTTLGIIRTARTTTEISTGTTACTA